MELLEVLQQIGQQASASGQPTDMVMGTVVSPSPLQISISTAMAPLQGDVLILTSAVIEKKIPILEHRHTISTLSHTHTTDSGDTSAGLDGEYDTQLALLQNQIVCQENGNPLPVENGYIILNRSLQAGEKVLLLRVSHGQRYIVLSRLYPT